MQLAFAEAESAAARGEVPVGAVITDAQGKVIAAASNRTLENRDPTAHAELLAIRSAAAALGSERLTGCDLYVTLEPCAMCAAAISFARIRRLYFAASDEKMGAVDHGPRFYTKRPATTPPKSTAASASRKRGKGCRPSSGRGGECFLKAGTPSKPSP